MLEAEGGLDIYLGENYRRVAGSQKDQPLPTFMEEQSINMIILSSKLAQDSRFTDDSNWQSFRDNPDTMGFRKLPIPGANERVLLIKDELIPRIR